MGTAIYRENSAFHEIFDRTFVVKAFAKINLRLKVIGRREDGYHLLSMLNSTVALADRLSIRVNRDREMKIACSGLAVDPATGALLADAEHNLACRAGRAFFDEFHLPFGLSIDLEKKIPIGAGLGGGSSDAAAVLRLLSAACSFVCRDPIELASRVAALGRALGADVPFLLRGGIARVGGIGEQIDQLCAEPFEGVACHLIIPDCMLETAEIFRRYRERHSIVQSADDALLNFCRDLGEGGIRRTLSEKNIHGDLRLLAENDLLAVVRERQPQIGDIADMISGYGDLVGGLTGSGSALFVLSTKGAASAKNFLRDLKSRHKGVKLRVLHTALVAAPL